MTEAKKAAAKTPARKKPQAKKPAAKKPIAKKAAAKPKPAENTTDAEASTDGSTAGAEKDYSLAFEKLVRSQDDLVGLLAYAKFKQSIREQAQRGVISAREDRALPPSMVNVLRSAAERMLVEAVENGIEAAAPDIQNTAMMAALESHNSEVIQEISEKSSQIEKHVTAKTGFLPNFFVNLATWVVSLLIAVLILYVSSRATLEQTLSGTANENKGAVIEQTVPIVPKAIPAPAETLDVPVKVKTKEPQ